METCPNNITLVLENMSDGHISVLGNRKKYVTSIILRIFLEILSYWKKKSFDITTNTIPIWKRNWMAKIWISWLLLKFTWENFAKIVFNYFGQLLLKSSYFNKNDSRVIENSIYFDAMTEMVYFLEYFFLLQNNY